MTLAATVEALNVAAGLLPVSAGRRPVAVSRIEFAGVLAPLYIKVLEILKNNNYNKRNSHARPTYRG